MCMKVANKEIGEKMVALLVSYGYAEVQYLEKGLWFKDSACVTVGHLQSEHSSQAQVTEHNGELMVHLHTYLSLEEAKRLRDEMAAAIELVEKINDFLNCKPEEEGYITILSADGGHKGKAREDEELSCNHEDCNGTQYVVDWGEGETTVVCGCGLEWLDNFTAQIIE